MSKVAYIPGSSYRDYSLLLTSLEFLDLIGKTTKSRGTPETVVSTAETNFYPAGRVLQQTLVYQRQPPVYTV